MAGKKHSCHVSIRAKETYRTNGWVEEPVVVHANGCVRGHGDYDLEQYGAHLHIHPDSCGGYIWIGNGKDEGMGVIEDIYQLRKLYAGLQELLYVKERALARRRQNRKRKKNDC